MPIFSNIWAQGALSEIAFYAAVAVILLPFAMLDSVILRKISFLKPLSQTPGKESKRVRIIASILVMLAVTVSAGCVMQFVFQIDILADDRSLLALFVLAISAFSITMCMFDFIRYWKLKKLHSKNKID